MSDLPSVLGAEAKLGSRRIKRWSRSGNGGDTAADYTGHRLVACHK